MHCWDYSWAVYRNSTPDVFLEKDVLKLCSKFKGEHTYRSVISMKLLCDFIEITLQHGSSPISLLHIFRTPFSKNASGVLPLNIPAFNFAECFTHPKTENWKKQHIVHFCHFFHFSKKKKNDARDYVFITTIQLKLIQCTFATRVFM